MKAAQGSQREISSKRSFKPLRTAINVRAPVYGNMGQITGTGGVFYAKSSTGEHIFMENIY
jgi:hypothetical protein